MLTQDEKERERYEARQKAYRDHISAMQGALKQGLEQGELMGRIHLCEQHLQRPLTSREALASLSLEELRQRAEQLEEELFGS